MHENGTKTEAKPKLNRSEAAITGALQGGGGGGTQRRVGYKGCMGHAVCEYIMHFVLVRAV